MAGLGALMPAMRVFACQARLASDLGVPVPDLRLPLRVERVRGTGAPYGSSSGARSRARSGRQGAAYATYASRMPSASSGLRISNPVVLFFERKLARDDGRGRAVSILQDLENFRPHSDDLCARSRWSAFKPQARFYFSCSCSSSPDGSRFSSSASYPTRYPPPSAW